MIQMGQRLQGALPEMWVLSPQKAETGGYQTRTEEVMVGRLVMVRFGSQQAKVVAHMEVPIGMCKIPKREVIVTSDPKADWSMQLRISEPDKFYSSLDEGCFFYGLKTIPTVESVIGDRDGLVLEISRDFDKNDLKDLIGIMMRYGLDLSCLRAIAVDIDSIEFNNHDAYWYKSMFRHSSPE
jgi:hypothetical protein